MLLLKGVRGRCGKCIERLGLERKIAKKKPLRFAVASRSGCAKALMFYFGAPLGPPSPLLLARYPKDSGEAQKGQDEVPRETSFLRFHVVKE